MKRKVPHCGSAIGGAKGTKPGSNDGKGELVT